MKKIVLVSLWFSFIASVNAAEVYQSRISDFDREAGVALVYLENDGRVLRLESAGNEKTIQELEEIYRAGDTVSVSVVETGNADQVQILGREVSAPAVEVAPSHADFEDAYEPSDFGTIENVQAWFYRLEYDMKEKSQCYQRAHNWVWMLWQHGKLKTQKTFIFFTKRYIREYGYKWWFHVAPMALVQGNPVMMDRSFTRSAIPLQNWKNIYMKNGAECPVVQNYSEYSQHQEAQYCYLMFAPMYYYQPHNVEKRESGVVVNAFQNWDLRHMVDAMQGSAYRKWKRAGLFDLFL